GSGSTNSPTVATNGGISAASARACSALTSRGVGANTKPMASAPAATAARASSRRVMPQIVMRVGMGRETYRGPDGARSLPDASPRGNEPVSARRAARAPAQGQRMRRFAGATGSNAPRLPPRILRSRHSVGLRASGAASARRALPLPSSASSAVDAPSNEDNRRRRRRNPEPLGVLDAGEVEPVGRGGNAAAAAVARLEHLARPLRLAPARAHLEQ